MVRKLCATIALANCMPHPPVRWVCCVLAACLCASSASLWLNPSVCRRLLLVVVAAEQSPDYFARPSPSTPLRVAVHVVALASLGGPARLLHHVNGPNTFVRAAPRCINKCACLLHCDAPGSTMICTCNMMNRLHNWRSWFACRSCTFYVFHCMLGHKLFALAGLRGA